MKHFYIKSKVLTGLIFLFCLAGFEFLNAQTVVYVASDGTGDGSSWATAKADLQDAITTSAAGTEIWVKAGTYYPPTDSGYYLKDQVSLYGGFAGTETDRTTRIDFGMGEANETILSGDIDKNSVNDSLNANNVIVGLNITSATYIDGFTIKDGWAVADGRDDGAGMYLQTASPLIMNCTFYDNYALDNAGGVYTRTSSEPAILNCYFINNRADDKAGAIYHQNEGVNPYIGNCLFLNNTAAADGGALYLNHTETVVASCTFARNSAGDEGAAIMNYLSSTQFAESPTTIAVINCVAWGNQSADLNDIDATINGQANITNCAVSQLIMVRDGVVETGTMDLSSTDPMFKDTTGTVGYGGYDVSSDWSLKVGSPLIDAGVLGVPENDILGKLRDTSPDIGAYEYFDVTGQQIKLTAYAKIFPNPTSESVHILPNIELSEIVIFDITGRVVESINSPSKSGLISVNLGNNPKGLYFIKLIDLEGKGHTEKLILK